LLRFIGGVGGNAEKVSIARGKEWAVGEDGVKGIAAKRVCRRSKKAKDDVAPGRNIELELRVIRRALEEPGSRIAGQEAVLGSSGRSAVMNTFPRRPGGLRFKFRSAHPIRGDRP
jgi:hypothetical protein